MYLYLLLFPTFAGEHYRLWARTLFPPIHLHFTHPPAPSLSNGLPPCSAFLSLTPSTACLPLLTLILIFLLFPSLALVIGITGTSYCPHTEAWHTALPNLLHRLLHCDQRSTLISSFFGRSLKFPEEEAAEEVKILKCNHLSSIKALARELHASRTN